MILNYYRSVSAFKASSATGMENNMRLFDKLPIS